MSRATDREHIAALSLQGILASGNVVQGFGSAEATRQRVAAEAVACADALLAELSAENGPPPAASELALERGLMRVRDMLERYIHMADARGSTTISREALADCLREANEVLAEPGD